MDNQFKEVYQILKDDLFRLAYSYTNSIQDSEDVMQEVFVKLYNNINKLNTMEDIKKWCIRVTINKCKDLKKSIWKRKVSPLDDTKRNDFSHSQNQEVLAALFSLPPKYRVILFLYYYGGYKGYEIASILNKKESTIRSLLSRGREKLKIILKEMDINE